MLELVYNISKVILICIFSVPALANEVQRLESEGWDLSRCQTLPPSSYNLKKDSDRISVKFLNDTGSAVKPAYVDLKGNVKFLKGPRSADEVWSDKTVRNTNWLWFDNFDRCIGMAKATKDWADGYQLISKLSKAPTSPPKPKQSSTTKTKVSMSVFCTEGDCDNGIGKIWVPSGGHIMASFKNKEANGFAFQVLTEEPGKEMFCEINMAKGFESGVRHCYAMQVRAHVFMHPKVNGRQNGRTLVVAPNGQVLSHKVYKNGKEVTLEVYPNDQAAVRDGRSYLLEKVIPLLSKRREERDRRIDQYVRPELWKIPGFKLSGGALSRSASGEKVSKQGSVTPKKTEKEAPATKTTEPPVVVSQSRPKPKPKPKPREKDPIDTLVDKAAELDRGARQYNPLYKLERVYVDREAYELVYEFQALKSIDRLNQRAMEMGAEAAYCKGFKMIPFRKQNMPSRWKYLDSDGNTMTIVTRVEDC